MECLAAPGRSLARAFVKAHNPAAIRSSPVIIGTTQPKRWWVDHGIENLHPPTTTAASSTVMAPVYS